MTKNIFIFFVSLLFCTQLSFSQEMLGVKKGGVRLGFDLSRLGIFLFENGTREAWEVSMDLQLSQRVYLAAEFGHQNVFGRDEANYIYASKGNYLTLGLDRILFDINKEGDNDILYSGFRYGYSSMRQEATYTITDDVFGSIKDKNEESISIHWLEAVFGLKTEVIKNVSLGLSVRAQFGLILPKEKQVPHYLHAGYGNSENKLNVGFTYSIHYRLPFYKLKQASK